MAIENLNGVHRGKKKYLNFKNRAVRFTTSRSSERETLKKEVKRRQFSRPREKTKGSSLKGETKNSRGGERIQRGKVGGGGSYSLLTQEKREMFWTTPRKGVVPGMTRGKLQRLMDERKAKSAIEKEDPNRGLIFGEGTGK